MLKIKVQLSELYDEEKEEFITEEIELELEHSLVSLSKWESEFEKPFLGKENKTPEEILKYIEAMILTKNAPENILDCLSQENLETINKYIDAKMTATWFNESETPARSREQITSELIYYWIVSYQIPWEVEYWHLNRLFTLIKVFSVKNEKPKKMNRNEMLAQRRALNERRRAELGTTG